MLRRLLAVLCLAGAFLVPATAARAAHYPPDTLSSGHVLRWSAVHDELGSANGRFRVLMQPSGFELDGGAHDISESVWTVNGRYRGPEDSTHLTMQRNGNLVLRHGNGDLIWQTRTRGAGNRLQILNTGDLVVRTARGRTVWQSHTTNTYLQAGDRLRPGAHLILHATPGFPTVRLIMHTNGDLVLSANGRVRWHSNTHVAGSSATISSAGALVLVGPHGNVRWRTPAYGKYAWAHITQDARIVVASARRSGCWQHPAPIDGNTCDSG